jgi:hypothetical protein
MNKTPAPSSYLLESLVHHIALPPRLPGKEQDKLDQIESSLAIRLVNASRFLRDRADSEVSQQWEHTRNILQTCKTLNAGGKLNKSSLLTEFRKLEHQGLLILHVAEQNAGLLIRRHHE